MKNFILILVSMIIFMCIPSMVIAKDTCSLENIKIESIELKDKTDIVLENSPVSIDNKKINLDLKMYEVGDYVEYELNDSTFILELHFGNTLVHSNLTHDLIKITKEDLPEINLF